MSTTRSAPTSPLISNLISDSNSTSTQQQQQQKNTRSSSDKMYLHPPPSTSSNNDDYTSNTTDSIHHNGNNYTSSPINTTTSTNSTSSSLESRSYSTSSEEEEGSLLPNTTGNDDNTSSSHSTDSNKLKKLKVDTKNFGSKTASGHSRIFNCKLCQRAFTREEHLTRHVQSTHNKLKPFVCGICTRPFSRRDLLLRHAKNLHDGSEKAISRIRRSYKNKRSDENSDTQVGDRGGDLAKESDILGETRRVSRGEVASAVAEARGGSISEETEVSDEVSGEEEEEGMYSNRRIFTSRSSNNHHHHNHHRTGSDNTTELVSPIDETPETKRLKMSVNMLVS
ncbi:hypothetical protein CANMA_005288 [Candida margitis]|uniref:uncharacterized protein n=1 Tax=Candida margitis TaxID=1775924 RepID=UPI002225EBF6|nr:uncharacterized protein CANMA_005288 [Candida margitis]KAI5950628.1 hypothetical protein CANMA_005288 [Candida margitis]